MENAKKRQEMPNNHCGWYAYNDQNIIQLQAMKKKP